MFNPKELAPDERLGRSVSSRRHRRQVQNGSTPVSLFYPREIDEGKLSVDRISDEWLVDVTLMAQDRDSRRGRNFYGWATSSQELVSNLELKAKASPKTENIFHADICIPTEVCEDENLMDSVATELAAKARLQNPAEVQDCSSNCGR